MDDARLGDAGYGNADRESTAPVVQPTRPIQKRAVEPQGGLFSGRFGFRRRKENDTVSFNAPRHRQSASSWAPDPGSASARPVVASQGTGAGRKGGAAGAVSLICGIIAIVTCFVSPPLGMVVGIVALVFAGFHLKGRASTGFARTGRICGILAIILSIVITAATTVMGTTTFSSAVDGILNGELPTGQTGYSIEAGAITSDDEREAVDAVGARLTQLVEGDREMAAEVGAVADEDFTALTGYSMQECGVDPAEYGAAALEGFAAEVCLASAYSGADDGFVSADVTAKDSYDIMDSFTDALGAYIDSSQHEDATEDERKAKLGEFILQAVEEAPLYPDGYFSVDVLNEDGTWVVDEASWDSEMKYLFGLS